MKLLAVSDRYIPREYMETGLAELRNYDIEIEVRPWEHQTLEELQEANLVIEMKGPEAVTLPEDICREVDRYDIVVTQFTPISGRLIDAATRLKLVGVLRGGLENVDLDRATQRHISVFNTPGRNARAVAECTIGLILAETKNIARAHHSLKQGVWTRDFPNKNCVPELYEKTVGLVGFGTIGRLVAKYLEAFGAKVLVYDPFFREETPSVRKVDLATLMRESDIVSIHARYYEETHHLVGRAQLESMKPTAVLVNTARSALVDEEALIDVLRTRRIMGAALDVFNEEPLTPRNPFLELDNVTIVPHIAGSTADALKNTPRLFASNLIRCLRGERDLPIVNGVFPALSR